MLRSLLAVAGFAFLTSVVASGRAHDLEVDQLSLWPNPGQGSLRGQLLFDPELTRALNEPVDGVRAARALAYVERELSIEVDGRRLALDLELRELWEPGGAVPADSVMLSAALPASAESLVVRAPATTKQLLVVISMPRREGGSLETSTLLGPSENSPPFQLAGPEQGQRPLASRQSVLAYLRLGFEHIVPHGLDHVLFVVGLVLCAGKRPKRLLLLTSGFTLAHTLTLALGASGLVVLPARLVEPLIALSIAALGIQNLRRAGPELGVGLVFAFGLLHGLGFAGVLRERAIEGSIWLPLLGFNCGVELGQLLVVGLVWVLLLPLEDEQKLQKFAVRPGSIAIAVTGVGWAVARFLG